jgi:AhpD family alkylhydroperoxidase
MFALEKAVGGLDVDLKLRQLIKMRVSQLNGCLFCLDMHVKEARLHGDRELRMHHLAVWRESSLFDEKEKAGLEWAELLTNFHPHGVTDEDYQRALKHFSEKQLSDLTFVVMTINAWNRLGVAFRTPPGLYDKTFGLEKAGLT